MLLEDCVASMRPVKVREPHFKVFPEFYDASYAGRYERFCMKLVLERHYDAAALILSEEEPGRKGQYSVPNEEIGFRRFATALEAHLRGHA